MIQEGWYAIKQQNKQTKNKVKLIKSQKYSHGIKFQKKKIF